MHVHTTAHTTYVQSHAHTHTLSHQGHSLAHAHTCIQTLNGCTETNAENSMECQGSGIITVNNLLISIALCLNLRIKPLDHRPAWGLEQLFLIVTGWDSCSSCNGMLQLTHDICSVHSVTESVCDHRSAGFPRWLPDLLVQILQGRSSA